MHIENGHYLWATFYVNNDMNVNEIKMEKGQLSNKYEPKTRFNVFLYYYHKYIIMHFDK